MHLHISNENTFTSSPNADTMPFIMSGSAVTRSRREYVCVPIAFYDTTSQSDICHSLYPNHTIIPFIVGIHFYGSTLHNKLGITMQINTSLINIITIFSNQIMTCRKNHTGKTLFVCPIDGGLQVISRLNWITAVILNTPTL